MNNLIEANTMLEKTLLRPQERWQVRHARLWMIGLLLLSDGLMLFTAGALGFGVRLALLGSIGGGAYLKLSPILLAILGMYALRGLYPGVGLGVVEEFRRLTLSTSVMFLLIITITYLVRGAEQYSRLVMGLTYLFALGLVPLGRVLMRHLAVHAGVWGEPVAVIGPLSEAARLAGNLQRDPKLGLRPLVLVSDEPVDGHPLPAGVKVLPEAQLGSVRAECNLSTALVLVNRLDELPAVRRRYGEIFERLTLLKTGDGPLPLHGVEVVEFGHLQGLQVCETLLDRSAQVQKRLVDLLLSGLGLILLSPLFALLAVLIRLDSPGPVFYLQKRLGRGGKIIHMLKFRTMHVRADELLERYLQENEDARRQWQEYQKLQPDPRITRVGRILRRYSIDELPQLWNVFAGEMSLVGPRPIMPGQRPLYGEAFRDYVRVTPGMTGLWQISGRNRLPFSRRVELDMHYVQNWSVWLDLYIILRTVWVVLRCEGAG